MSSESMPFRNGNQLIGTEWLANQTLAKAESQPAQVKKTGKGDSTKAEAEVLSDLFSKTHPACWELWGGS